MTSTLDTAVPAGRIPTALGVVAAIVRLCACAHGEWIRIHPFANGNGRTGAGEMSIRRDHRPTEAMFVSLLQDGIAEALGRS